jgi:hypothetical protein
VTAKGLTMKNLILGFLLAAPASYATTPITCQLNELSVAVSALNNDKSANLFFDLDQASFSVSPKNEPTVIFIGHSSDLQNQKICSAQVTMEVPEETLGCPEYKVKTITTACEDQSHPL